MKNPDFEILNYPNLLETISRAYEKTDNPRGFVEALRYWIHSELSANVAQPIDYVRWVNVDDVIANDYNPNSVAIKEMQLLHKSIQKDGYCVEESTPILKADLTWVKAGELKIGDKLIAFDENSDEGAGKFSQRKFRTSEVLGNFVEEVPELLEVTTDRGTVSCTPDHPFLVKVNYGKGFYPATWVEAKDLKPSDIIIYLLDTWEFDQTREAGWLAGFLDGEGTLSVNQNNSRKQQTYRLSGYQRPSDTATKMIYEMGKRVPIKKFVVNRANKPNWNDMVMVRVDRFADIMKLLGTVRPERLISDGGYFWEGMAISSSVKDQNNAYVQSVKSVGMGKIARLSTTTKTYISNGFASHNTQPVVVVWDEPKQKYVIVDGFHRTTIMKNYKDIQETTGRMLPVVVIDKDLNERKAATVRHNRARGTHSVVSMSDMVFSMLENGMDDAAIANELGMEAEEVVRLKHITGFSKLFADKEYSKAWETKHQILLRKKYETENTDKADTTAENKGE